ncbi:MAG: hypothetical protein K0S47_154 [Herbinix sp.]|jgi:MoaA/NifB/PqqE/SkfB family radical SAM enzyme|nr:hypothetical protein [Herbinix sp.]
MYINLKRVEYIITYLCSGRCKHCSVAEKVEAAPKEHITYQKIQGTLQQLSKKHQIESVMCFGGEPLLYADDVCGIFSEAYACGIPARQLITNGYFSKSKEKISEVAKALGEAHASKIMLSLDAFHEEMIPLELVHQFAEQLKKEEKSQVSLHPAWVVNREDDNPYNNRTKEILDEFADLEFPVSKGNNIFPAGNAVKYLSEYFPEQNVDLTSSCGRAPYTSPLDQIDTISILPNGDVGICHFVIGNIYREDINTILDRYDPYQIPMMRILMEKGVLGLIEYAEERGVYADVSKHYSACSVCRELRVKLI